MIIDWNRRNYLGPATGWIEYPFGGILLLQWPIKAFRAYSGTRAFIAAKDGIFRAMKTLGFKVK